MAKMTPVEIRKATEGFNTKHAAGQILCDLPDIDPNRVFAPLPKTVIGPMVFSSKEQEEKWNKDMEATRLANIEYVKMMNS